jgi:hypothetical protein
LDSSSEIVGILVELRVDGVESLFLLLDNVGGINRMGNGSVDDVAHKMFSGRVAPELFMQLRSQITPGVVHFLGQRLQAPQPKGKLCELTVMLRYADGREATSAWRYGSESQGPHPEVRDFVVAAVQVTEPWFEQQQQMVARTTS